MLHGEISIYKSIDIQCKRIEKSRGKRRKIERKVKIQKRKRIFMCKAVGAFLLPAVRVSDQTNSTVHYTLHASPIANARAVL